MQISGSPLEYPIAIIGAGPGGLFTSMHLSKLGLHHVLIEGQSFPRDKSCADVLPSIVLRALNQIDPNLLDDMLTKGMLSPLEGTRFFHPSSANMMLKYKQLKELNSEASCYAVRRAAFDHYLLEYVKKSPYATVYEHTHIQNIKDEGEQFILQAKHINITAKLVIIAAGSTNKLNQCLGLPKPEDKHFALGVRAYFKGVQCKSDESELFIDRTVFPGGVYISPLSEGLYNVNVVMKKDAALRRKVNLEEAFHQMVVSNPVLREKFKHAEMVSPFRGAGLFLGTKTRQVCGKGFMLVGDAAGLIDLLSANGIPQAVLSAELAAKQAKACFDANDFSAAFMQDYQVKLYKRVKGLLALARLVNPLAAYRLPQEVALFGLYLVAGKPYVNRLLQALVYERRPLLAMMNPFFYLGLRKA
ncbi:MAG: NAD(P)/FAD-dependent oxidoreductase [Bacteroidota bacterium]|nr:NAD(P)/FAD-dependent oxidoreductase [Bacteroidota bacterium]MDX5430600.1 NAD(P)/FAD-dependent oxidoreductase [Bacteroidota bacterium]MDX5469352.1 NAD(P)/FAD-dependent oxidoreductase [Bacteroidota bacterium]